MEQVTNVLTLGMGKMFPVFLAICVVGLALIVGVMIFIVIYVNR